MSCQNNSGLNQSTHFESLLQVDSVVTCPFECVTKVDLTHLKQHMIDKHSSSHETEMHNVSLKRSDSIPCEKVSESCDINPLRNEYLYASAVQKASCQNNSELDQYTQFNSLLRNDTVTGVTCPFECSTKVDLTGLKQHIIDNHSSSHETEMHNYPPKPSEGLPFEKNEDLNASAVQKVSCKHNSELDQSIQLKNLLQNDTVTVATCPFECGTIMDLMDLKQHIIDNHSSSCETESHTHPAKGSDSLSAEKLDVSKQSPSQQCADPILISCPFECGIKVTETGLKHHLMDAHSSSGSGYLSTENVTQSGESNPLRNTFTGSKRELSVAKFNKLIHENKLCKVVIPGNGYCFISSLLITLAEAVINKMMEVSSVEVMNDIIKHICHYRQFDSELSTSSNEQFLEACSNYFHRGLHSNEIVDVSIGAVANTICVN